MRKDSDVALDVLPPGEVSAEDRAAFEEMVLEAGEVNPNTLLGLIDRALALVFARLDGALVGGGAIKRPYGSHRGDVFKWAKCDLARVWRAFRSTFDAAPWVFERRCYFANYLAFHRQFFSKN